MHLIVLGLSHSTAPVAIRERFAIPAGDVVACLDALSGDTIREAVILSTCNRVEIYAVCARVNEAAELLFSWLEKHAGTPLDRSHFYLRDSKIFSNVIELITRHLPDGRVS